MSGSVRYQVEHETRYEHEGLTSTSQHAAWLTPRELPHQHVRAHQLEIDPAPSSVQTRTDYFGNQVQQFALLTPYTTMTVVSRSVVDVDTRDAVLTPAASPAWEQVRDTLRFHAGARAGLTAEFCYPTPFTSAVAAVALFARETFTPGRPLLDAALALMHRVHDTFTFDPAATTLATPPERVLEERRGVCQDFAHLSLAALRALGLPARYVSGYLLTDPPAGQPRLVGADASHAWLSVWCPVHGWVDLDPTNGVVPSTRHVTLAWGRDYGDVSPLRGVVLGGGAHNLRVGVTVSPIVETSV